MINIWYLGTFLNILEQMKQSLIKPIPISIGNN